ncbi:MAG: DUF4340 domain-containing protein [Candidatus Marinimicrobia bacterium]|nr:DUF4340 domain-containing protein [Candidatus Neomarinimicrobiota bacterium]
MKWKNLAGLTGILVLLFIAIFFFEIKGGEKRESKKRIENLLFSVSKDDVVRMEIRSESDSVVCEKTNDVWSIVKPISAGCDTTVLSINLTSLLESTIDRKILDTLTALEPFGLDSPRAEVILTGKDAVPQHLLIGDENPTGASVYVKYPDKPDIFTTNKSLMTFAQKNTFDFRDKKIMHIIAADVRRIEIVSKIKGRTILEKSGDVWNIVSPVTIRADNNEVQSLLNRLQNTKAKSFESEKPVNLAKYGLSLPSLTIRLFDKESLAQAAFSIGTKNPEDESGASFAKESTRDPVFTVENWLTDNLHKSSFDLQDKNIVSMNRGKIDKVVWKFDDKSYVCEKSDSVSWKLVSLDNAEADEKSMKRWLNGISELTADELVSYSPVNLIPYGLDKPQLIFSFFENGNEIGTILIGWKVADNYYYIKSADKPFVYKIAKSKVVSVRKTADELMRKVS